MNAGREQREGFSLAEILVAIVLVALVAAAVIPVVLARVTDATYNRQTSTLATLAQATMTYHDHVGMWPSSLVQLATSPAPGATNLCGNAMAAKDTARWQGPYVSIPITGNISLEGNTILSALVRSPAGSASPGVLQIQLQFPDAATRTAIQTALDVDTDSLTGVIRWSGSDPSKTLTYNLPITGC